MKLTFISNFFNHHQEPLCNEFFNHLGQDFTFIATKPVDQTRIKLGYEDSNAKYPYILKAYATKENHLLTQKLMLESDVVIFGSAPLSYLIPRLNQRKSSFIYTERFFKQSFDLFKIRYLWYSFLYHGIYRDRISILSASAYLRQDLKKIKYSNPRLYKWGYFPRNIEYSIDALSSLKNNQMTQLLWVARFIKLKHPELALDVAQHLKHENIPFHLTMIGDGPLKGKIELDIQQKNLQDEVSLRGPYTHEDVRKHMEKSNIFLFTSDQHEGWGAVINEAMNSGCAVIAPKVVGSIPFLLNRSPYVYQTKDEFFSLVRKLTPSTTLQFEEGLTNYKRIHTAWNAKTAVDNLFKLIDAQERNIEMDFVDQPCEQIHQDDEHSINETGL